jgi:hypothetical protein
MDGSSFYRLNSLNRIVDAGGAWDAFARAAAAPGAGRDAVIGRSIWEFLQSAELQGYMNTLFVAARVTGHPISLPYRCDSKQVPRRYMMTITPLRKGGLMVRHDPVMLSLEEGPNCLPLTAWHTETKCSVCCAVKVGEQWIDPFVQPSEMLFPKGLGVCPKCKAEGAAKVAQIMALPRRKRRRIRPPVPAIPRPPRPG